MKKCDKDSMDSKNMAVKEAKEEVIVPKTFARDITNQDISRKNVFLRKKLLLKK